MAANFLRLLQRGGFQSHFSPKGGVQNSLQLRVSPKNCKGQKRNITSDPERYPGADFNYPKTKKFFWATPPKYHEKLFLRDVAKYYALTGIPAFLIIMFINTFIGPAELTEIPEDYEPEEYEYHDHPITRFIVRNLMPTYQENYEKMLAKVSYENEKKEWRQKQKMANYLMQERGDGLHYFVPMTSTEVIDYSPKTDPDQ
ncbi:NADH dehydrogenase [ubiquinone] 1 beta subcomplex subunit 5, mitochondrial-like [Branchiostoma floridae x Branchiostoma belcheri]